MDFSVKPLLPLISAVMYRKTRHDHIESTEIGKRIVQIVFDHLHPVIAAESLPRRGNHRRGKIESDAFCVAPANPHKREQASVSGSQIENPPDLLRDELKQSGLAFGAMWNAVSAS
jgi:hypothetical protein